MSKIPSLFVPCSFELRLVQNQSSQRTVVEGLPFTRLQLGAVQRSEDNMQQSFFLPTMYI